MPAGDRRALDRDARHPLGLRLPDRRGRGLRSRRGGRFARGRGLRHQLRRAAALLGADEGGAGAAAAGAGRCPVREHPLGRRQPAPRPAPDGARAGRRPGGRRRLGRRARLRRARGARTAGGTGGDPVGRAARGLGAREGAGPAAARDARLREPLRRGPVGGRGLRRRGRRAAGPGRRVGDLPDPLRLARPRLPGLRRLPPGDAPGRQPARDRAARPPALLRAAEVRRRPALPRRDGRRGELRLRQPPADGARRARGAGAGLGLAPREHRLRTVYDVCHNIAKLERHPTSQGSANCASTARGRPAPSGPAIRRCPRPTATWASRC